MLAGPEGLCALARARSSHSRGRRGVLHNPLDRPKQGSRDLGDCSTKRSVSSQIASGAVGDGLA